MIGFIKDFIDGEIDSYFFKLDYDAYVIEHFPYMENENPALADRFVNTIDYTYENIINQELTDDEFRTRISAAFNKWLRKSKEA
jgi:hypothetical protein